MTLIVLDEHTDPWIDLSGHSAAFQRMMRRLVSFDFSEDAEAVLVFSNEKFMDGCEEHGYLDLDHINPSEEMLKEHIDLSHYAAMEIVRQMRHKR